MARPISFSGARVQFSLDGGTTFTDLSDHGTRIEISGGSRQIGEVYTFSQDYPYLTTGKREPWQIRVYFYYDEQVASVFPALENAYKNATRVILRWAPLGFTSGNRRYTSEGYLSLIGYPEGQAGSGEPVITSIIFRGENITMDTVP